MKMRIKEKQRKRMEEIKEENRKRREKIKEIDKKLKEDYEKLNSNWPSKYCGKCERKIALARTYCDECILLTKVNILLAFIARNKMRCEECRKLTCYEFMDNSNDESMHYEIKCGRCGVRKKLNLLQKEENYVDEIIIKGDENEGEKER